MAGLRLLALDSVCLSLLSLTALQGRHDVHYTTWSGPGLYTINARTGHVRWQFPIDNWFRYWVKDIDLPSSASFSHAAEVRARRHAASRLLRAAAAGVAAATALC